MRQKLEIGNRKNKLESQHPTPQGLRLKLEIIRQKVEIGNIRKSWKVKTPHHRV